MTKSCDACAKRVNEVRNFFGADVCARCAKDLREAYDGPQTMRSPVSSGVRSMDPHAMGDAFDDFAPDTETFASDDDREGDDMFADDACPGCGSMPGDGITYGCDDPAGCGVNRANQDASIGDAIAQTQRSPSHMKHESAKFDGNAYMEETVRLEEARKTRVTAPVNQESIGHVRQLRTQEHPNNRIRIGK